MPFDSWVASWAAFAIAGVSACVPWGAPAVGPPSSGALRVAAVFGDTAGHLGGSVSAVAISGDGRIGAIGGEGVEVFEIPSLRRLAFFPNLNSQNGALALSPDGSLVVACGSRGADAEIWSVHERRRLAATGAPWKVFAAAFSWHGGLLALGGEGLGIGIWNVARGRWTWRKQEPVAGEVKSLQFSDDDRLLLSATKVAIASGDAADVD